MVLLLLIQFIIHAEDILLSHALKRHLELGDKELFKLSYCNTLEFSVTTSKETKQLTRELIGNVLCSLI